jgi:hypothetical protein
MTKKEKPRALGLTARDCVEALRKAFPMPAYALFEQVGNATGARTQRWADVLILSIWPSRGLNLSGFEIKVFRSDWKKELAEPAKSEAVQKFCDNWFVVAPQGLIEASEMPECWGLLEVTEKRKLVTAKPGPTLQACPMTKDFLAALLRRQAESFEAVVESRCREARQAGEETGAPEMARRLNVVQENFQELSNQMTEFERASGVDVRHAWDCGKIGEAVRKVMNAGFRQTASEVARNAIAEHRQMIQALECELSYLESVGQDKTPSLT